jgi:hypothetical protein
MALVVMAIVTAGWSGAPPYLVGAFVAPACLPFRPCGLAGAAAGGLESDQQHHPPTEPIRPSAVSRRSVIVGAIGAGWLAYVPAIVVAQPSSSSTRKGDTGSADARTSLLRATDAWLTTVTSGTPNAAKETARLYSPDAVLWGTVSEEIRDTPAEIEDYFNFFANLKGLSVSDYRPLARVFGDVGVNDGYYTFSWVNDGGEVVRKQARFRFLYRRDPSTPSGWAILDHHSSAMPDAPAALRHGQSFDRDHPLVGSVNRPLER